MTIDNARETRLQDAVEQLLDAAVETHTDKVGDETLTECHICGKWEEHHDSCPIPALQKWQNMKPGTKLS